MSFECEGVADGGLRFAYGGLARRWYGHLELEGSMIVRELFMMSFGCYDVFSMSCVLFWLVF